MTKHRYNANRFAARRFLSGRYRGTSGTNTPDFMYGVLRIRATLSGEIKVSPSLDGKIKVNQ